MLRVVGIGRIKKPDRVIRLGFYGVRFPKLYDLGQLSVFRFVELAKEGFVEWLADVHASSDQFAEDRHHTGDHTCLLKPNLPRNCDPAPLDGKIVACATPHHGGPRQATAARRLRGGQTMTGAVGRPDASSGEAGSARP